MRLLVTVLSAVAVVWLVTRSSEDPGSGGWPEPVQAARARLSELADQLTEARPQQVQPTPVREARSTDTGRATSPPEQRPPKPRPGPEDVGTLPAAAGRDVEARLVATARLAAGAGADADGIEASAAPDPLPEDVPASEEPLTREETARIRARLERVMFLASGELR